MHATAGTSSEPPEGCVFENVDMGVLLLSRQYNRFPRITSTSVCLKSIAYDTPVKYIIKIKLKSNVYKKN